MSVAISSKSSSATRAPASKRKSPKKNGVSEEEIRILAFDLYERRCQEGVAGDDLSDWMEAERRLLTE